MASYQSADYFVVDTLSGLEHCLRIGETNTQVSQLLVRHKAKTGLIITAWNPHSQPLSQEENQKRNQQLLSDPVITDSTVHTYPSYGADDDQTWREEGFFFTNIDCLHAQQLCDRYQQNAGVLVDTENPVQLIWHPEVILPKGF